MHVYKRLLSFWLAFLMVAPATAPLAARTKQGDKLLKQGHEAEKRKQWDQALDFYEQALSQDPSDAAYRLFADRVRFQAAAQHVHLGQKIRSEGKLEEALAEFEKAYAIDPSSPVAAQELRRTHEMIDREKARKEPSAPQERALTPQQEAKKQIQDKINSMLPVPELKALNPQPINLKMNNQPPKVLFETVGKLAGINVLFDPDYTQGGAKNQNVDLSNLSVEEALDYVGLVTKSFWKPLSQNTIFVTQDNTTKRRDYEEQVMKVFYLQNITQPQELQEILTTVRSVADIQRLFPYNAQNAIVARGEADRIALAEKIIADLDKPKPEVVVDVVVMEANKVKSRDLAAAIAPDGLNQQITFNPRSGIRSVIPGQTGTPTTPNPGVNTTSPTITDVNGNVVANPNYNPYGNPYGNVGGGLGTTTATQGSIPLANIARLSSGDFSVAIPGGLIQAVMNDRSTRVLQTPQLRALDNVKASLRIGDKVPTATGSFQPGIGGVGINPLVNTQFTFIEVGVNLDITPKIHGPDDVSLHVVIEISNVRDRINLGGISQPVIGQRKIEHDVRLREGEVNLIGGLLNEQESKTVTGIPGLASIPVLGRLFSKESVEKNDSELLIVLVPHIVRSPEITQSNLRGIAVGNTTFVKLNYAPRKPAPGETPTGQITPPASSAPQDAAPPQPAAPPATAPPPPAEPKPAAPPAAAQVFFAPATVETQLSAPLTVNLNVENAVDLAGAPMQIKFDHNILRLSEVSRGMLLGTDPAQTVFTRNILNDAGTATINLNRPPGVAGVSGSGTLLTLTFQAVGRGIAAVSIPGLTLRDSKGQAMVSANPQLTVTVR